MTFLDIDSWKRKDQYHFFKNYDNPFFNICVELDITKLHSFIKKKNISFFKASLFLSLKAANAIENFRYRIRGDQIVIHDTVHAGSTVLNQDETFSFCYFDYNQEFSIFNQHITKVLEAYKSRGKKFEPQDHRDDLIHYSVLPWISFTSVSHPRRFNREDSIPKIVFGKFFTSEEKIKMPLSIEAHHSLMDGLHVAKYLELFQKHLNQPEEILIFK